MLFKQTAAQSTADFGGVNLVLGSENSERNWLPVNTHRCPKIGVGWVAHCLHPVPKESHFLLFSCLIRRGGGGGGGGASIPHANSQLKI